MTATLLRAPGGPVLRVGHRGAKGHAPENTFASFNLAVQMGVSAVETDVHLSHDGEVVLIHDHTVDRTTDGHGYVKDLTLAALKELDAGAWFDPRFAGERIPTLGELLGWAKGRVAVAIEIKNGPIYYPGIAGKVIRLLREHDMLGEALLISFDHLVLREAKMLAPEVASGLLYVARLVDPVGAAHAAGLAVSPWCPNDAPTLRALAAMGVDSIGTDYPELFDTGEA